MEYKLFSISSIDQMANVPTIKFLYQASMCVVSYSQSFCVPTQLEPSVSGELVRLAFLLSHHPPSPASQGWLLVCCVPGLLLSLMHLPHCVTPMASSGAAIPICLLQTQGLLFSQKPPSPLPASSSMLLFSFLAGLPPLGPGTPLSAFSVY